MDPEDRSASDENDPTGTDEHDPTEATGSSSGEGAVDETETKETGETGSSSESDDESSDGSSNDESTGGFDNDETSAGTDDRVGPKGNVSSGDGIDEESEDAFGESEIGDDDAQPTGSIDPEGGDSEAPVLPHAAYG